MNQPASHTASPQAEDGLFKAAWDMAYDGMIAINGQGTIHFCNTATCRLFGYSREELLQRPLDLLIPPGQQRQRKPEGAALSESDIIHSTGRGQAMTGRHKEGRVIPLEVGFGSVTHDGQTYTVAIIRDVTERREMEKKLQHYAYYDQLTGLVNRTFFYKKLYDNFERARRYGESFALLYLDLDKFKSINHSHGHAFGNEVLAQLVSRISPLLRTTDIFARLGDDDFMILLTATSDITNCEMVASRIIEVVKKPVSIDSATVMVGVNIGIAFYEKGVDMPETLVRNADKAMYVAKSVGQNQYMLYDPSFTKMS